MLAGVGMEWNAKGGREREGVEVEMWRSPVFGLVGVFGNDSGSGVRRIGMGLERGWSWRNPGGLGVGGGGEGEGVCF